MLLKKEIKMSILITKCDYCGFSSDIAHPGDKCPKCNKGIMCELKNILRKIF
jgi:predicted Zn-ribbon and HTH transcriptional regulator